MSKGPKFTPKLDQEAGTLSIQDPVEASILFLQTAESRQHALMSGWGGPGHTYGCHITEGETKSIIIRVPSGTYVAHIGILVTGTGAVTITSDTDATGTDLTWAVPDEDAQELFSSEWTSGQKDGEAASTGRDVEVSSAAAWRWEYETLTLVSSGSPYDGTIWGVVVYGVHSAV